jgi:hypothetical protein
MPYSASPHGVLRVSLLPSRISHRPRRTLITVGFAILSLAACGSSRRPAETSQPTAAEKAYLQNIQVIGAHMTAAQNFLQHTVVTLHANITNKGNQTVRHLELDLAFSNYMGQIDLREKAHPINANTPALKPGETRAFEVSFDHVPGDWNQAPPQITPVRVVLAGSH